jgi:hypothetical protein
LVRRKAPIGNAQTHREDVANSILTNPTQVICRAVTQAWAEIEWSALCPPAPWHTLFLIVNTLFLIVAEMIHILLHSSMNAAPQDTIEIPDL